MISKDAIARLKSQLLTSGLSDRNSALFQIINTLIDAMGDSLNAANIVASAGGSSGVGLQNATYITVNNEVPSLPNSRRLLAGTNITFDDTVANQRTINGAATPLDYVVASDGVTPVPAPVDDGFGNFIYVPYTP